MEYVTMSPSGSTASTVVKLRESKVSSAMLALYASRVNSGQPVLTGLTLIVTLMEEAWLNSVHSGEKAGFEA